VVGADRGPTPPDLSSRSLFSTRRREREREPGIRKKNSCSTPHRERYNDKVLGAVAIFSTFVVLLIEYAISINVVYSLLIYSVRTSANEGETDAVVIFKIPHSMYLVSNSIFVISLQSLIE